MTDNSSKIIISYVDRGNKKLDGGKPAIVLDFPDEEDEDKQALIVCLDDEELRRIIAWAMRNRPN